jgi:hypothetical protein
MNVEASEVQARLTGLLEMVAYQKRNCKLCGEFVYWVRSQDGRQFCLDALGHNHRLVCKRMPVIAPLKRARQHPLFLPDAGLAFDPVK